MAVPVRPRRGAALLAVVLLLVILAIAIVAVTEAPGRPPGSADGDAHNGTPAVVTLSDGSNDAPRGAGSAAPRSPARQEDRSPTQPQRTDVGTLSGVLHSAQGKPIGGATVHLLRLDRRPPWTRYEREVPTDSRGRFRFRKVPAGEAVITASDARARPGDNMFTWVGGQRPRTIYTWVTANGETTAPPLVMPEAVTIEGRIELLSDLAARPKVPTFIAGGDRIRAVPIGRSPHPPFAFERWGKIGRNGRFTIAGVAPGSYELLLWNRSMRLVDATAVMAGASDVVLRATSGGARVQLTVLRAEDRAPVPEFTVTIIEQASGRSFRRTARNGRNGEFLIRRLPPGPTYLRVTAADREPILHGPVDFGWRDHHRLELRMTPPTPGSGLVVDSDDRPIAGAEIERFAMGEPRELAVGFSFEALRMQAPEVRAWSDANGRFEIRRPLFAAAWRIRAPGYAAVRLQSLEVPQRVVLHPGIDVRGTLRCDRGPPGIRQLGLRRPGQEAWLPVDTPQTEADGSFLIEDVAPGRWQLTEEHSFGHRVLTNFELGTEPIQLDVRL